MISDALRFEGFDSRSWTNFVSLFAPTVISRLSRQAAESDAPEIDDAMPGATTGTLILILDEDNRVIKALHTQRGRVTGLTYSGPGDFPRLAERYGARHCIALREGALEEIAERFARRIERGDDYVSQCLTILRATRELIEAGQIHTWPDPLSRVPIPTMGMVRRAMDVILPDDHSIVCVLWDGATPWTGVVLRRQNGAVDLVAGPDLIGRWTGPLGGDWRRDYRVISQAVARVVAPVHIGLFCEVHTMKALLRSADPGAWARAVAVRDIILHPTPPYVAVALGADALRAVAQESARWLGGIDALGRLAPVATYVRGRVAEVASVTNTLGFDPLKALAEWIRRSEDAELEEQRAERESHPPPIAEASTGE